MSAAVAGMHWLWGWIGGAIRGIRDLFRKERRKIVSISIGLVGSVKRRCSVEIELKGIMVRKVWRDIRLLGENFTGIVADLLFLEEGD